MKFTQKQIDRKIAGEIIVFSVSAMDASVNVTANLAAVAATAGFNGMAIPILNSLDEKSEGLIISGSNLVEVYNNVSKKSIYTNGSLVYGRLTFAVGVYTVSFFYKNNLGVEVSYVVPTVTLYDLIISYRFKFETFPTDSILKRKQVFLTANSIEKARDIEQVLTVSGLNAVSSLTNLPAAGTKVFLIIRGKTEVNLGVTPSFTMSGNNIGWIEINAGYPLEMGDEVIAKYKTLN